jgi:hypothetical protein
LRKYTNNGTHIYRLRNNLFIRTTCFDPNGSSSGVYSYTSLIIELQRNILVFTYTRHTLSLSLVLLLHLLGMSLNDKLDIASILIYAT